MEDVYMEKENARFALQSAIEAYKKAAQEYGSDEVQMADEIEQALADSGLQFEVCT